ncbi:unnamed protein product [Linum trigynum]|uniref:Secreted protein n=1 Tax=Linum trigynum TaxID=586398 RepID=A0AAV2ER60_9ROSI
MQFLQFLASLIFGYSFFLPPPASQVLLYFLLCSGADQSLDTSDGRDHVRRQQQPSSSMAAIATSVSPSFCYRKSSRIDSCFLSTDTFFSPPWTSNASTPSSRSWTTRSKLTCSEPRCSAAATDCSRSAIRTRKSHSGTLPLASTG